MHDMLKNLFFTAEREQTIAALSERLSIDRTNVSRLCARMESKGELLREPHPADGRAVQLRLTAHGKDVARMVDAASAAHFEAIFDQLGVNGEQVIEALGRLVKALTSSANQQRDNKEL